MKKLLFILLLVLPSQVFGCMMAKIFKVHPVGMCGDTIVTVDLQIYRAGEEGFFLFSLTDSSNTFKESVTIESDLKAYTSWMMYSYITKYDKHQNPIEIVKVDSTIFFNESYLKGASVLYDRAFEKIKQTEKDIQLFQPKNIQFCDFEDKCAGVKIDKNTVTYRKQNYPIEIVKDTTYYGIDQIYVTEDFDLLPICSVRKYKAAYKELVVVHCQIGQMLGKYKKPKVKFTNIEASIYEEPIYHHGNGYDIFFLTESHKNE